VLNLADSYDFSVHKMFFEVLIHTEVDLYLLDCILATIKTVLYFVDLPEPSFSE
jgi:hypothetical protein